jgi:ATP-binding cassette subfamily C protein
VDQANSVSRPSPISPSAATGDAPAPASRLDQLLAEAGPGLRVTARESAPEAAKPAPAQTLPSSSAAAETPAATPPPERAAAKIEKPVSAPALPAAGAADRLRHLPEASRQKLATFVASEAAAAQARPAAAACPAARPTLPLGVDGSELMTAIAASRQAFVSTGMFSLVINLLMLAGPLFMLQVYDRVLTSGSIPTLVALSAMTAGLYAIIGLLELARSRVIVRIGVEVDRRVGSRVFKASLRRGLTTTGGSMPALRELDNLRQFLGGPGPLTFFDAPWTPVYLAVIFATHWTLGIAATIGATLLTLVAWLSETTSRAPLAEANKAAAKSIELAETGQRNAEAITAMGMLGAYRERWHKANDEALAWQVLASDKLGNMSSLSKALRLLLQSLMLAIGAALAIKGEISAGAIVAATIIFGRALAPVEQAISHWRSFVKARESFLKLDELLRQSPEEPARTALPAPKGRLEVEALRVASPETRQLILSSLNFSVVPGTMLAVIGPSASGKSTLARTLVGLWKPFSGTVKLDGARLEQWDSEELGRHIGYLPQDVELFAGTVKENIARFRADASDDAIVDAARMAHAHELILALPQGYETQLGAFGTYLSAGQRQRIGLSRALFGNPALVVLDEPNSNLDRLGDEALASAVDGMRARGQAVVLISHRVQAIGKADFLLYLERGVQRAFGPREEVMKLFERRQAANAPAATPAAAAGRAPVPAKE